MIISCTSCAVISKQKREGITAEIKQAISEITRFDGIAVIRINFIKKVGSFEKDKSATIQVSYHKLSDVPPRVANMLFNAISEVLRSRLKVEEVVIQLIHATEPHQITFE